MKMKNYIHKYIFILLLAVLVANTAEGQVKSTTQVAQVWMGYFNQTRLTDRWGFWTDLHLRTKEKLVKNISQGIVRAGLTYYLNDATKITAGYAFVNHFPADAHKDISQPEHRIWQQIQWHTKYKTVRTMQWIRLEERYRHKILNDSTLAKGYNFNWRVRYNFFYQVPLSKNAFAPHTFSFIANDEIHINLGKQIVYNYFDQNRFFLGFAYHTNAHDNLQFGYMNIFQQLAAGNQYRSTHTARIFYFHNLDLRKKKGK